MFERKDSDGSSFWSLSARNSVSSMFDSSEAPSENCAETDQESPRRLLQKKRSSLSHKPDPAMLILERKTSQEPKTVHEFQKVCYFTN